MRRLIGALLCAGCVMFVIPGAAVPEPRDRPGTVAGLSVQRSPIRPVFLSDELTIILVGTGLIGLAALVRRRTS